jgi:hypothetical protein
MKTLADQAVREALASRVQRLDPSGARRWGKMSPHEMMCHLSDSFRAILGEKAVSSSSSLVQRTIVKFFALYVPLEWPKGVPTRPEVEQGVGGTPPADWERDRDSLLELMERFARPDARRSPHPMFGAMREKEWMRWGYLHVDHHLRQFGE